MRPRSVDENSSVSCCHAPPKNGNTQPITAKKQNCDDKALDTNISLTCNCSSSIWAYTLCNTTEVLQTNNQRPVRKQHSVHLFTSSFAHSLRQSHTYQQFRSKPHNKINYHHVDSTSHHMYSHHESSGSTMLEQCQSLGRLCHGSPRSNHWTW